MPNTSVQATGEAMPKINRRFFLGAAAAVSIPAAAALPIAESSEHEAPAFDLQHWLDTNAPRDVARYHAARLTVAMNQIRPDKAYRFSLDEREGYIFIVGDKREVAI